MARSSKSHSNVTFGILKEPLLFSNLKKSVPDYRLNREHLQIFAEILNFCEKPQVKTRVMYKMNLSYTKLQKCLPQLVEIELLEMHHNPERYATTRKGHEFLGKWKELQELLQP